LLLVASQDTIEAEVCGGLSAVMIDFRAAARQEIITRSTLFAKCRTFSGPDVRLAGNTPNRHHHAESGVSVVPVARFENMSPCK